MYQVFRTLLANIAMVSPPLSRVKQGTVCDTELEGFPSLIPIEQQWGLNDYS